MLVIARIFPPKPRLLGVGSDREKVKSQSCCLSLEVVDLPLAVLFFEVLGPAINPCLTVGEDPVNQTAKIARHSFDCFGGSSPRSQDAHHSS